MVLDGHTLGIPRGQMTADSEPGTGSGSVGGFLLSTVTPCWSEGGSVGQDPLQGFHRNA